MDRLTADDRIVLWMDAKWAQDVGAIAVLDGAPLLDGNRDLRLDNVRAALTRRLHVLPRLRQVLLTPPRSLGWPLWVDDPAFDVRNHVRQVRLPAPGGRNELLAVVEDLRRQPLDRSRPLWEVWLLPGLTEGRVGLFVRLHHVVADGIAGLAALDALLDPREEPVGVVHPWVLRPRPTSRQLFFEDVSRRGEALAHAARSVSQVGESVRSLRAAWPATRELLTGPPGPSTSLDGIIGRDRVLAMAHANLADVTAAAHGHGATVNDVLLEMIAGGLRALLLSRGEDVEGLELPIYVPKSLRQAGQGQSLGNDISQIIVHVPIGLPDPKSRLQHIASAMSERKALARPSLGGTFRNRTLSRYLLKRIIRQRINVTSADIVGPTSPLRLAGAEVHEMFPLINLIGNVTLGVGALSYAGHFDVLVVADAAIHPDLDVFAAGARQQLSALLATQPQPSSAP